MKCVVFVPGIMGSVLRHKTSNKKVWPPSILETISGYGRINELMGADLVATKPIVTVGGFISVYRCILDDIERCGYTSSGANDRKFISFPYDWRRSNIETAEKLADHLDGEDSFDEIILIGHSMGGLVLRLLLESKKYESRSWFSSISKLITYGTPHNGAPGALEQVTVGDKTLGVSAKDIVKLASDARYPSAYQLVPPKYTALTVKAAGSNELPESIDSFDPAIISEYGLNQSNIDAARDQWGLLGTGRKPDHVDYFSFVGSALKTKYLNEWDDVQIETLERKDCGDGTVPISSSINVQIPHAFSLKKHSSIFEDRSTRFALYRMLDAPSDVKPMAADTVAVVGDTQAVGLSVDKECYKPQDVIEVAVSFVTPQTDPEVMFEIFELDRDSDDGDKLDSVGEPIKATFEGAEIDSFTFTIPVDLEPGVYELRTNKTVDDPERTMFMVSAETPTD
jgi:pimeloyl-ACP methyl ester carboxylesterase